MEWHSIVKIFIEFRNKGVSLSTFDLDTLNQWEKNSVDPKFIYQVMVDIYQNSQKTGKTFPTTLTQISRHVDKILIKIRDT